MAGLSAGLFIWPPLTRYLMDVYGWRGAILLHGSIHLHGIPLCALIRPVHRPPPGDKPSDTGEGQLPTEKKGGRDVNGDLDGIKNVDVEMQDLSLDLVKTNGNLAGAEANEEKVETDEETSDKKKNHLLTRDGQLARPGGCNSGAKCCRALFKVMIIFPHFLLYILAVIFVQSGNVMPYTLTPARADALGIDKGLGALLVSVSAGISGVCRVFTGYIGDRPWVNRLVFCGISGIIGGSLTAISVVPTTFLGLVIIFGIIALPSGMYCPH